MEYTSETHDTLRKPSFLSRKARHLYADQLLCLLVLLLMAVLKSGTRSLGLAVFAVFAAVFVDIVCCVLTRKVYNPRDLSTIITGLCLALMSPAALPYSYLVFASGLAIGVKHIFGGKDNYIFNPTAVAFAFLIICFPTRMLLFPSLGENLPLFGENLPLFREITVTTTTGLENLLLRRSAFPPLSSLDFLLGNFAGPIGTTHVLVIIVSAVCLLFRRSVSPIVTISCLSVVTIFRLLFPIYDDIIGALVRELFGGYLFFTLIFLANDPQTVPKTAFGKLYYGILLGVFTIIFRGSDDGLFRGKVEGWFIFAILASNTFSGRMDIISARVSENVSAFSAHLRKRLSAYEKFSEDAKTGKALTADITATMEIDLTLSNYDMPPVNNKVIKIKRKKRNLLTFVIEFFGTVQEKVRPNTNNPVHNTSDEYKTPLIILAFRALFDSIKSLFRKPPPPIPAPLLEQSDVYIEDETDSSGNVDITDFEEIAEEVAKIEAEAEEQLTIDDGQLTSDNEQFTINEESDVPEIKNEEELHPLFNENEESAENNEEML
jgi:electron transport complex protein RnfD